MKMVKKEIVHKAIEGEVITKRKIVCGRKFPPSSPDNYSMYWSDVNCLECLLIGELRSKLQNL
jgi:hypothetical protein